MTSASVITVASAQHLANRLGHSARLTSPTGGSLMVRVVSWLSRSVGLTSVGPLMCSVRLSSRCHLEDLNRPEFYRGLWGALVSVEPVGWSHGSSQEAVFAGGA